MYYVAVCVRWHRCALLTYALNKNGFLVVFPLYRMRYFFQPLYSRLTAQTMVLSWNRNAAQLRNNMMFDNTLFYMNMINLIRSHPKMYRLNGFWADFEMVCRIFSPLFFVWFQNQTISKWYIHLFKIHAIRCVFFFLLILRTQIRIRLYFISKTSRPI